MTLQYLRQPVTGTLKADGTGTLAISPPAGSWWNPTLVRVGVNVPGGLSALGPVISEDPGSTCFCTLYHGGATNNSFDAFVDSTITAAADVTGVLNTSIIQPGEFLVADFVVATEVQNPALFMEIIGSTSDQPQMLESIPGVMGSRFSGQPVSPSLLGTTKQQGIFFQNPGVGNFDVIIPQSPGLNLYLFDLTYVWSTAVGGSFGFWYNSGDGTGLIFDDPSMSGPRSYSFNGLRIPNGGLSWHQSGPAAFGTVAMEGGVGYSQATR